MESQSLTNVSNETSNLTCPKCKRVCKDKKGLSKHTNVCGNKPLHTTSTSPSNLSQNSKYNEILNIIPRGDPIPSISLKSIFGKRGRGRPKKNATVGSCLESPVLAFAYTVPKKNSNELNVIPQAGPSLNRISNYDTDDTEDGDDEKYSESDSETVNTDNANRENQSFACIACKKIFNAEAKVNDHMKGCNKITEFVLRSTVARLSEELSNLSLLLNKRSEELEYVQRELMKATYDNRSKSAQIQALATQLTSTS